VENANISNDEVRVSMTEKGPKILFDQLVKGRHVRAWKEGKGRRAEMMVQVWNSGKPEGEPDVDYAMPGILPASVAVDQTLLENPIKLPRIPEIKELVRDNKMARLEFYRAGELWYVTDDGFKFPVPISDAGNGQFWAVEKAITLMRYIRLYLEKLKAEV